LARWYGERSEATFGEIEQQAWEQGREPMGKVLEIVSNGRRTGAEGAARAPCVPPFAIAPSHK
jgi:hypothetical protein